MNLKSFNFKKVSSTKLNGWFEKEEKCYSISMNKENSLIIAGSNSKIKIYKFNPKLLKMKEIQILKEHSDDVTTLSFFKTIIYSFISGSRDLTIIIWSCQQSRKDKESLKLKWISHHKIQAHSNPITCLIFNRVENLIISGSGDNNIKFWSYNFNEAKIYYQQTIQEHVNWVYSLSINNTGNKVISCGHDQLILIIEYNNESQSWIVIQKIMTQYFGYRLSFITEDIFTFQPRSQPYFEVYKLNEESKQYIKTTCIQIQGGDESCVSLFPSIYCPSKGLLLSKNGKYLNLITIYQKENKIEFLLQQSIEMDDYLLFGTMNDDGSYLISWDDTSKTIQIYAQILNFN
ncbi:unnamed protein product [Paramecium sonneborni]|uniref:Uncharacterized protein n=1 Tax=Paramecium sonneborni TaxID=65129 RepID=A0A8S1QI00_9CILI|nr:unnamed protein product [Paramecium sonneborni]